VCCIRDVKYLILYEYLFISWSLLIYLYVEEVSINQNVFVHAESGTGTSKRL